MFTALRAGFRRHLFTASCLAATGFAAQAHAAQPSVATNRIGALFVSSSTYAGTASTIAVGQALPITGGVQAVADGSYPGVFNNDSVDANFGITSPITLSGFLTTVGPAGAVNVHQKIGDLDVTSLTGVTTSFPSKSELALNVSSDGRAITLMGYAAPINMLDVSNSNTPAVIDPKNTDIQTPSNRAVVELDLDGTVNTTQVSSYSGNNGRAASLVRNLLGSGHDAYLMVGNAGNSSGTELASLVASTGVQVTYPNATAYPVGAVQGTPGAKNGFQYGFSVASIGQPDDKSGKDDNFRGLTVFDGRLFVSKGSGGNGVNTVYEVTPGSDVLNPQAATISIVPGFPTTLAANLSTSDTATEFYPFGIFVANATTMYVADEGPGTLDSDPNAGLQKWVFDGTKWSLAYVLQNGLKLGQTYSVANYPSSLAPATVGLRNLAGAVEGNKVTLFAVTATYSTAADSGADPNHVVRIVDRLDAKAQPVNETFKTIQAPTYGKVYRGVAYAQCPGKGLCLTQTAFAGH